MANGNGTQKPKVEMNLGDSAKLRLLKDKPYSGENSFGVYYLYSVLHDGVEKAFFASPDLHHTIAEAGLKTGDEFKITKVAVQNGKKISSKVSFEVVSKAAHPEASSGNTEDGFRDVMERSLRDAIEATKAVNSIQWDVESIRAIALTIFIQRARG